MELYAIPIVILFIFILVGGTILYRRFYERSANQALQTGIRQSLPTPIAVFVIALAALSILIAAIQLLPILTIEDVAITPETPYLTVSDEPTPDNASEFDYYDMKQYGEDTIIAYSNHLFYSRTPFDTECDYFSYSRSQVRYFDRDMQEVWAIGGAYSNDPILFENQRFDARAITRLSDGSFVAFGLSVDLDTTIYHAAFILIDGLGHITDLRTITISDYGSIRSAWVHFEAIGTDDGGFTLLFNTESSGTILFHYDATAASVWQVRIDEAAASAEFTHSDIPLEAELLAYANQVHAIRVFNTILVMAEDGTTLFRIDPDFAIDAFSLIDDRIVLSGTESALLPLPESVIWMGNRLTVVRGIVLSAWAITDGSRVFRSAFRYGRVVDGEDDTVFYNSSFVTDSEGNYFVYADSQLLGGMTDASIVLRFGSDGAYRGGTVLKRSPLDGNQAYSAHSSGFKNMLVLNRGTLAIYTPNLRLLRTVSIGDLSFELPNPMPCSDAAYAFMIRLRVGSLQALLLVDLMFIGYVLILRYRQDADRERAWEERGPLQE